MRRLPLTAALAGTVTLAVALTSSTPAYSDDAPAVVQVATADGVTCVLRTNVVRCTGQLGGIAYGASPTTVALPEGTVDGISVGEDSACAVLEGVPIDSARDKGTQVWCWGDDQFGQLGTGATGPTRARPVRAKVKGSPALEVAVSGVDVDGTAVSEHACVIADDTVDCWGSGAGGQLGRGSRTPSPLPVQASLRGEILVGGVRSGGDTTCLTRDREAYCWGTAGGAVSTTPVRLPHAEGRVVDDGVSTSAALRCGVLDDGELQCWSGRGLVTTPRRVRLPGRLYALSVAVATVPVGLPGAGAGNLCVVRSDHYLSCGTVAGGLAPVRLPGSGRVDTVSVAGDHTCAVGTDGTVACWTPGTAPVVTGP